MGIQQTIFMNPFLDSGSAPKFNSALGYLALLDDLIRLACGYLIGNDPESYYLNLEAWYLCTIERFTRLSSEDNSNIKEDDINDLKKLRSEFEDIDSRGQLKPLMDFHEKLDELTNKAGLRMQDIAKLPGMLQGD